MKIGRLSIVGIGPGHDAHITPAALKAIKQADSIIGYTTYIGLVRHHLGGKQVTRTGMTEEIGRARHAVDSAAKGEYVTLISSGDAGVYGMAGLVFEVLRERGWKRGEAPEVELIPGVTAANSCASLVGAPLIHDTCRISLSDLLTPWPVIERRLENAAQADFVITLYNPASGRRQRQIVEAARIIGQYRTPETPVALVKSAYRRQQSVVLSDLKHFLDFEIGMNTTVIVGSSSTFVYEGYMVTPRGHTNKYRLGDGTVLDGQRPARSLNCEGQLGDRMITEPSPQLKITTIAGAFIKKVTETYGEMEPEPQPQPQAREDLNASAQNALAALALINKIKTKKAVEPTSPVKVTGSDYAFAARLAGGLVFRQGQEYFLIGDLKEACVFEDYGLQLLPAASKRCRQLRVVDSGLAKTLKFGLALSAAGAADLYRCFAIYRNDSISERLMSLVGEYSPRVEIEGRAYVDATWVTRVPEPIWEMLRATVLKC